MEQDVKSDSKPPQSLYVIIILACALLGFFLWRHNTASKEGIQSSALKQAIDEAVLAKWGKTFSELPSENLIIVSPHNDTIRKKFEHAFVKYYAIEKGKRVLIWWRQLGGSNAILDSLIDGKQQLPDLDVVFGGGEYLFEQLADADMLAPLVLGEDVLNQIPAELAGVRLRDAQLRWCGNVLSGFGFLYNRDILEILGLTELNTWQDLAQPELTGQVAIAGPQNSGSTVVAFEMILQSEPDWPSGWKKLLSILSNAKEFASSSDNAANAPLFDQAAAAICIDFYGISRQVLKPEQLKYVSPEGQTAFTPDPVGILNDTTHPEIANAFVQFVLSPAGQELWGKKNPQEENAMSINALYRIPIRRDFYLTAAETIPECVKNPYELKQTMQIDSELKSLRFRVLRQLVQAAGVDNFENMIKAKQTLIASNYDKSLAKEFFKLPANVNSIKEIRLVSEKMKDPEQAERIYGEWVEFFKEQYEKVLD